MGLGCHMCFHNRRISPSKRQGTQTVKSYLWAYTSVISFFNCCDPRSTQKSDTLNWSLMSVCLCVKKITWEKGSKSAKNRKPIVSLTEMSVIPEEDRVFKDCIHEYEWSSSWYTSTTLSYAVTVRHWLDVFMRKSELMEVLISVFIGNLTWFFGRQIFLRWSYRCGFLWSRDVHWEYG